MMIISLINMHISFSLTSWPIVVLGVLALLTTKVVYNLWLHPTCAYPGPLIGRATRLYYSYYRITGQLEYKTKELHDTYGSVVRIAPDELSYNHCDAWRDIYTVKGKGRPGLKFLKDPHFYIGATTPTGEKNMAACGNVDHSRIRGVLSLAFAERALLAQESILISHVDRLIERLAGTHGKPTDAVRWFHHAAYDIVSHLAFGRSEDTLECDDWSPQVQVVFEGIKEGVAMIELLRYLPFKHQILGFLMWAFAGARTQNFNMSVGKVESRMEIGDQGRSDFISHILRANLSPKELNRREIIANSALLIDAGTETTASMLSGCIFYLLRHPKCLNKLTGIIRSQFSAPDQMDTKRLQSIPYLNATIEESMRMYMPVPSSLPRQVPPEGAIICGQFVPYGTAVGISQYAAYRSTENFKNPYEFIPERWLNGEEFISDKRAVFQPFSTGARNCLGKNLAYAEIRLILGRILWNFDMDLMLQSYEWHAAQKTWFIWEKPELQVKFKLRQE